MIFECPGSKTFKQPHPESIVCPDCKKELEIWSDEPAVKCAYCGALSCRKVEQSCLQWCKYAKYCVGEKACLPAGGKE